LNPEELTLGSCAGMCELMKDSHGKYTRIRLKLSEPLLKFRPRSDLLNTLLHESIHAYFFVTTHFAHVRDPTGGHGPGFQLLASAINDHGSYDITQFHEFHDEVESYRTHIWQCDGPCRNKPPYLGIVKRTMNRAPGKTDTWWEKHQSECGGTYTKIAEPELTKKQIQSLSAKERAGRQKNKIDAWVSTKSTESSSSNLSTTKKRQRSPEAEYPSKHQAKVTVSCPICELVVQESEINQHLDAKHTS
jgi:hypothetical protein